MRKQYLVCMLAAALCGAGTACGGDEAGAAGAGGAGGGVSVPPPEEFDAEVPLPMTVRDAGVRIEGTPQEGSEGACAIDGNKIFELVRNDKSPFATPLSVDQVASRFGLSYADRSDECIDAIHVAHLKGPPGTGAPDTVLALDVCAELRETALAHGGDSWLLATVDNREQGYDLFVHSYDPDSGASLQGNRITAGDELDPSRVTLAASKDQDFAMVAWVEAPRDGSSRTLKVQTLDKQGVPVGDPQTIDGGPSSTLIFTSLSMAPVAVEGAMDRMYLAYNRFEADGAGEIVLQLLGRDGAPIKNEWVLTSMAGQDGHVDVATGKLTQGDLVGGVVYSMRVGTTGRQLWFQSVSPEGEPSRIISGANIDMGAAPAKRLVGSPKLAQGASLTRMPTGVGFAVAYRALALNEAQDTKIRVIFTDREGNVNVQSDLVIASAVGGRTSIESSFDGRFVVGWSEVNEEGETIYTMVRLPCSG